MPNLFSQPPRSPLIGASILSADFARMGDDCRRVLAAGADFLHLDVMDGHFVPNLTMGPDLVRDVHRACPGAFLDVHLMVAEPARFVEAFALAGAHHMTFHAEAVRGQASRDLIARIRSLGASVGVAVNPATPADAVWPVIGAVDLVLVMSVNPGSSGQAFIAEVLPKVIEIKSRLSPHQRLEMDGGLGLATAESVGRAGCDVLAVASAIFREPSDKRSEVIGKLRDSAAAGGSVRGGDRGPRG